MRLLAVLWAAAALVPPLGVSAEESPARAAFLRAKALVAHFNDAAAMAKELYFEELAEGARREFLPKSAPQKARSDIAAFLQSERQKEAVLQSQGARPQTPTPELDLLLTATRLPQPLTVALRRFQSVLEALIRSRDQACRDALSAACDFAEDEWLTAKTAEDLASARHLLLEAKALCPRKMWLLASSQRRFLRGSGDLIREIPVPEVVEVFDLLAVIAVPQPLLFPDPAEDPKAYCEATQDWRALAALRQRFTMRPRIRAHIAEMEHRRKRAVQRAAEELQTLMLGEADRKEFAAALVRYRTLDAPSHPFASQAPRPSQNVPLISLSPDFHTQIGPPVPTPLVASVNTYQIFDVYSDWQTWLAVRNSNDLASVGRARDA